jgi:hypothetical protein
MPAGLTYTPIARTTFTSAAASVTFSSISGSYTDLVVVCSFLKPTGGSPRFRLNSDTGSNYSQTVLRGNGTTAASDREGGTAYFLMDFFTPSLVNPNIAIINLMNYSNTTTYKTILERSGCADVGTQASVGVYRSTSAITSITINADGSSGVFSSGSTFVLYGILAA